MHNLPSLNGLRAFEAAARCGSFVLAGAELGVSSAAVSLHVKSLEDYRGKMLFVRKGNRIFLTDAGEEMYPKLARAFSVLAEATQVTPAPRRSRNLVISVLPALARQWLLPRALEFQRQTGITLDIRVQEDPIDFEREAVDLRLTYGSALYAGYGEFELFPASAIPVCSPAFWAEFADPDALLINVPDEKLIHNRWGPSYSSEPLWTDWNRIAGRKEGYAASPDLVSNDLNLVISAARQSAGVALVPEMLARADLESGALIAPSNIKLAMKKAYVCVYPNARTEFAPFVAFKEYIGIA